MNHPRSWRELRLRLSSEESCRDLLFDLRWPGGFVCSRCKGRKAWSVEEKLYECASCGLQTSVTAGTIFQNTRAPLSLWFRVIWWITGQNQLTTASALQRITGHRSYETAWMWLQKLRQVMVPSPTDLLSGIVEVSYLRIPIGRRSPDPTEGDHSAMIAVAAQADNGGVSAVRIRTGLTKENLEQFMGTAVARQSVVVTTPAFPLKNLSTLGYIHDRPPAGPGEPEMLPRIRMVVSDLMQWLRTIKTPVNPGQLQVYIDEFVYAYNSRDMKTRGQRFLHLLRLAVSANPQPKQVLIERHHRTTGGS